MLPPSGHPSLPRTLWKDEAEKHQKGKILCQHLLSIFLFPERRQRSMQPHFTPSVRGRKENNEGAWSGSPETWGDTEAGMRWMMGKIQRRETGGEKGKRKALLFHNEEKELCGKWDYFVTCDMAKGHASLFLDVDPMENKSLWLNLKETLPKKNTGGYSVPSSEVDFEKPRGWGRQC